MVKKTRDRLIREQIDYLDGLMWSMTITPEKGHDFYIFHATPDDIDEIVAGISEAIGELAGELG